MNTELIDKKVEYWENQRNRFISGWILKPRLIPHN